MNKGFANIILVLIIVILAGVVGYFVFVNKSQLSTQKPGSASDLSTPESAARICISALRQSDKSNLQKCLSDENRRYFERKGYDQMISFWQMSLKDCPYEIIGSKIIAENKAEVKTKQREGCDDTIRMIKEGGEWKFNES